jgi:DNA-binding CsgD family transcriptional regulator
MPGHRPYPIAASGTHPRVPPAGPDLIRAVVEYAATPRVTPAYVSVVHDGEVVVGGWLPGTVTSARPSLPAGAGRRKSKRYATGWSSLTEAELRVVSLVVSGLTNREIARRLHLSWHTVNAHLRNILHKLDLHRRVDLTRIALQHNPELARPAMSDPDAASRARAV